MFSQLFLLFVLVLLFIVAVVSQLFYVISFSVIVLFISIFSVEVEVEVSMRQQFRHSFTHTKQESMKSLLSLLVEQHSKYPWQCQCCCTA